MMRKMKKMNRRKKSRLVKMLILFSELHTLRNIFEFLLEEAG